MGWTEPYYVDADHINLDTVGGYLETSDFFTLDVAYAIGRPAGQSAIDELISHHPELVGNLEINGIEQSIATTCQSIRESAGKFLFAVPGSWPDLSQDRIFQGIREFHHRSLHG